jgi:hypothetical protein
VDGLEYLNRSLQSGNPTLLDETVKNFFRAAEADEENYEALYIKGHILGAERVESSNVRAEELLTQALKTENQGLRALVHAGLANCYAQKYFRLAMRKTEIMEKAQAHVEKAYKCWEKVNKEQPHAWILAADAFVRVLELMSKDWEDNLESYRKVAELYFNAIKLEENNSAYSNALGFILLKLMEQLKEQEYTELDIGIPPDNLNVPQKSEHYLKDSLEVDPSNKLAHANLCLLYATDWYREKNRKKYLELSRDHGLKAVELDQGYINGFRDLTISLLRYGEIKQASSNFKKAINLTWDIEKKKEIKDEIDKVLDEMGTSKEKWYDLVKPDSADKGASTKQ